MNLHYIRSTYGVPAFRGTRIRFVETDSAVRYGTITGGDTYLHVQWDGGGTGHLHPTWHVYYLGEHGEVTWPDPERGPKDHNRCGGAMLHEPPEEPDP